ncbi:CitMHS family transporter [Geosporobacter ferrireducens]|uniref:Citrate transporter-like domain-containing protein n=1 Tax=Geosporobacter ferrireducens TaxID=1424294 RepID=A0A1D8GG11_9FIRM|nr:SLC13 family permease [Geosporobacter ferrireducens]AOT69815.1 hypothetical protein Gferi_09625 [Geosporobacter ferrireducens]
MVTVVGFILLLAVVMVLIKGRVALPIVFVLFPVIAAVILGFPMSEITGFVGKGLSSVLNVAALFTFSVTYFSMMNDVGMFDVIVKKVMRYMGNKVALALLLAAFVATISHLDGSGATTMLVTIPTMLPIFRKMKIRPEALLLFASAASGIMNLLPWCSSVMRLSSSTALDPQLLWRTVFPLQVVGLILVYAMTIPIAKMERKNGAGMSDEEFEMLKTDIVGDGGAASLAGVQVNQKLIAFNMLLTLGLIVVLLTGLINANLGFMMAFAIGLFVNYRDVKVQNGKIKEFGGNAMNMVMVIFAIGVFLGIMQNTGMIEGMANTILAFIPESLGGSLIFIIAIFSVPLSVIIGSDAVYLVLAPILISIAAQFGGTAMSVGTSLLIGGSISANITLIGPTPYLALGLANVSMGDHLRYSFKWIWGIGVILAIIGGFIGIIPF